MNRSRSIGSAYGGRIVVAYGLYGIVQWVRGNDGRGVRGKVARSEMKINHFGP